MKFRIFLKSFHNDLIQNACQELQQKLIVADCKLKGIVAMPIQIKKFCVLRSPHIDKDSREHFEIRLYKRFIDLETIEPSVLDILLKTELPAGVSCSLKVLENQTANL